MKLNLRVNLTSGIFAVLFGGAFWFLIPYQIVVKQQSNTNAVNSDFLPKIIAAAMVVLGVALIVQSLLFKKDRNVQVSLRDEGRVCVVAAIILAYMLLMPKIGFLITSIAASVLVLLFLRCKKWLYYVVMILLAAGIYFSFKYGLMINLP